MSALIAEARAYRQMPTPRAARAIRLAAGVSQTRLAHELGVHPVTVARWESGTRHPGGDLARRYVDLLTQLKEVSGI